MQRLFTMFPQGAPGVALLLLRVAVSLHVVALQPALARATGIDTHLLGWCALLPISLLLAGFCTPVTAAFVALLGVFVPPREIGLLTAIAISSSGALALIGPGAYSLDARRFGRRRWSSRNDRADD